MSAGLLRGLVGTNLVQWLATGLPGKTIEGGIAGGWIPVVPAKRALGMTRPTGDLFASLYAIERRVRLPATPCFTPASRFSFGNSSRCRLHAVSQQPVNAGSLIAGIVVGLLSVSIGKNNTELAFVFEYVVALLIGACATRAEIRRLRVHVLQSAKPPWVVICYAGIAALHAYLPFWHQSHAIL